MRKTTIALLVLAGLLTAGLVAQTADAKVSDQDVEKMKQAMPAKAPELNGPAASARLYINSAAKSSIGQSMAPSPPAVRSAA